MNDTPLTIRRMQPSDLGFLDSLRQMENWNQTPADLQRFLEYEPEGCFIACWQGAPAGTVTTTRYGTELGWIGMMLVQPDYRRRGIASRLIQASLDYLNGKGVECIKLDATPAGEAVYQRLGFQTEWEFERWERPGELAPAVAGRRPDSWRIPELDGRVFGARRNAWLERIAEGARVIGSENAYGIVRAGSRAAYLGPVIAENSQQAERIIEELLEPVGGLTYWDVPTPNPEAVRLAERFGFRPIRQLLRMWTGRRLVAGDVSRQYAIADPATG